MTNVQQLIDVYREAVAEEAQLYEKVKGHGPGINGFNSADWQAWLDAVQRTTAASKALREGFSDPLASGNSGDANQPLSSSGAGT